VFAKLVAMKRRLLLFLLLLLPATNFRAQTSSTPPLRDEGNFKPNERAEQIARRQEKIISHWNAILETAKGIKPDGTIITQEVLDATYGLLGARGYPELEFTIAQRRKDEPGILAQLRAVFPSDEITAHPYLLAPENTLEDQPSIFPFQKRMNFIAAPGAAWGGHHVYPGGLVYHTYTIMHSNLNLAKLYKNAYGISLNEDLLVIAAIWHDAAKTWTITWKPEGTTTKNEGQIVKAGAHHVLSVAEMAARGFHSDLIVATAAAHDAITEGTDGYQKVMGYLVAAAILAGKPFEAVGLKASGKSRFELAQKPAFAPFINHLGDADWVATTQAMKLVRPMVDEALKALAEYAAEDEAGIANRNWKANEIFAENGAEAIYHHFIAGRTQEQAVEGIKMWLLNRKR